MTSAVKLQRPKGTQDLLPSESAAWGRIESICRRVLAQANYHEIRTPVFEDTQLFERGVGETTDIVNKEMYTFTKEDRSLTLRPENTAGVVRAFIENGLSRDPKPVKLFYLGPMFRYERPQAGRLRQFHQLGAELFGLDTPAADAEIIDLAMTLFTQLGLPNLSLEINNIGSAACRDRFKAGFREIIAPFLNQLCADCQTRYETNPLRMLDCKVPGDRQIYAQQAISDFLEADFTSAEHQQHFAELTKILAGRGIAFRRNSRLVRGLDYYTGLVFEIVSSSLGAQNTVCGGGRYNNLVEMLGGPPTPAVGWAIGMERLMSLLPPGDSPALDYYIVTDQPAAALNLAQALRDRNQSVEVDLSGRAFGKQLAQADKRQARRVIILGESEQAADQITLKHLAGGEQQTLPRTAFLNTL